MDGSRVALTAAVFVIIGAALAAEGVPLEGRGAMLAGSFAILLWLAAHLPPDDPR